MPSIDDIASVWALRCDGPPLAAAEQADLEAWLAADRRHRGALIRAQAVLSALDTGSSRRAADDAQADARTAAIPAIADADESGGPATGWGRWTVAAGLATALALAASLLLAVMLPGKPDFATQIGERQRVALQDGSQATLNTDSQLDVAYSQAHRNLTLRHGEAWFKVAHNAQRPFIVSAGPVRVKATGTAFSVRLDGNAATVVVSEGRVLAWIEGQESRAVAIARGAQASVAFDPAQVPQTAAVDVSNALAWRDGRIALDGQSGAQAAQEFNRYNVRPITIRNAAAARYTLVGYFRTDQSLQFANALAQLSGASVSVDDTAIVIE